MRKFLFVSMSLLIFISCKTQSNRIATWGSDDATVVIKKMATSLFKVMCQRQSPVLIKTKKVRNRTSEYVDIGSVMLVFKNEFNGLAAKCANCSCSSINPRYSEGMLNKKMMFTGYDYKRPNYFLTGSVQSYMNIINKKRVICLRLNLSVIDLTTGLPVWSLSKEFLRGKAKMSF